jgi:hypothetical protein
VREASGEALGEPCDPGEIAAITLRQGAEELVHRLREAVRERARSAASTGADAKAWLDRLHGLDRMPAGTIHAFCGRILREHAPEAGLDPEFEVVDEERAAAWLGAAARGAVVAARRGGAAARGRSGLSGSGRAVAAVAADLVRQRATRGDWALAPRRRGRGAAAGVAARQRAGRAAQRRPRGAWAVVDVACAPSTCWSSRRRAGRPPPQPGSCDEGQGAARQQMTRSLRATRRLRRPRRLALEAERLAEPQGELAAVVADAEARYAAAKRKARALDFDDRSSAPAIAGARCRARRAACRPRAAVDEHQTNAVQQQV